MGRIYCSCHGLRKPIVAKSVTFQGSTSSSFERLLLAKAAKVGPEAIGPHSVPRTMPSRLVSQAGCRLVLQAIDDRTLRAPVAVALLGKLDKRPPHVLQCLHLAPKFGSAGERHGLHFTARALPVRPQ